MNRALKLAACGIAGLMMQAAFASNASAEYMGYGNGDPGNWDYNTEQAGGPCNLPGAKEIDATTGQAKCCSQYNPMSMCPLAHSGGTHLYRHPKKDAQK